MMGVLTFVQWKLAGGVVLEVFLDLIGAIQFVEMDEDWDTNYVTMETFTMEMDATLTALKNSITHAQEETSTTLTPV